MTSQWIGMLPMTGYFPSGWGQLAASAMTMLIAATVLAFVMGRVNSARTGELSKALASLCRTVDGLSKIITRHEQDLANLSTERAGCELKAVQTYPTRAEIARLISDTGEHQRRIHEKIDGVHGRITSLATEVAKLNGAAGAKGAKDEPSRRTK